MGIFLILASILAVVLTVAGVWGVFREKRQWKEITEKAKHSGIRPDWLDEFDKQIMSGYRQPTEDEKNDSK